jgi:hypothetical protein
MMNTWTGDAGASAEILRRRRLAVSAAEASAVTLVAELERLTREQGDAMMVVSSTASENTVRFYLGREFEPMAEPLPELYQLEPEDVHMHKKLA